MNAISRTQIQLRLADAKRAYEAGNEVVAWSALNMCWHYGEPVPQWLRAATLGLMVRGIQGSTQQGQRGRHARLTTRLASQLRDVEIAASVLDELKRGSTWDDVSDARVKAYKRAIRRVRTRAGRDFLGAYISAAVLDRLAARQGNK